MKTIFKSKTVKTIIAIGHNNMHSELSKGQYIRLYYFLLFTVSSYGASLSSTVPLVLNSRSGTLLGL